MFLEISNKIVDVFNVFLEVSKKTKISQRFLREFGKTLNFLRNLLGVVQSFYKILGI